MDIAIGEQYRVKYPFTLETFHIFDFVEGQPVPDERYRPGCSTEQHEDGGEGERFASGEGEMIMEVIDIHKPGKYPARVFYTRRYIDPEGNEFGSGRLQVATKSTFRRRAHGYYHDYIVD